MIPLVLVADSDPFALLLLEEACRGAGCEVMTALDGAQVLDLIARQPPSLLILDAALPRVDGEEVARILATGAYIRPTQETPYFTPFMKDGLPLFLAPFMLGTLFASYSVGQSALKRLVQTAAGGQNKKIEKMMWRF